MRHRGPFAAAALIAACLNEPAGTLPGAPATIDVAAVVADPHNVLSAVVSVRVREADSLAVRFHRTDAPAALDSTTPAIVPLGRGAAGPADNAAATAMSPGQSVDIPVLGLLPETRYDLRPVAYGRGHVTLGPTLTFATGSVPADLPHYVASGADPSPGYIVLGASPYGLVIDNTGRVVWYRRFSAGLGLNFEVQPTGRYYAHPPTPDPTDREPWVELDPLGEVVRSFGCANDLASRFHDLIAEPDGAYWILCDETRPMDLSGLGGVANAQVTGTVVQHIDAAGALLFQWSPFDHFAITDLDLASRTGANVNWTHGNALDLDTDGNLIVSFRSLSEITKIDTKTGAVLWRLGGLQNQFAFQGAPTPAFSFQHGLRHTGPGQLLLLDNLGDPAGSRAERYVYDGTQHTARQIGSYGSSPGVIASLGGSTQDLPGGHTLVSYGPAGRVEEYDASGQVVWHIEGNPGYVFRAQRIWSLYRPGVGSPR